MAIFGVRNTVREEVQADTSMTCSTACFENMIMDFNTTMHKAIGGLYISDAQMEFAVTEGADASVLLEGVGEGFFGKIKEAFKSLWAKIKGFFAAVKRFFELIWKSGSDFVNRFEEEINRKHAPGFKYDGYKYDVKTGDTKVNSVFDKVKKEVSEAKSKAATLVTKDAAGALKENKDLEKDLDKMPEELTGFKSDKMVEEIKKLYRGGKSSPSEIKFEDGASRSTMMKFISDKKETVSKFDEDARDLDDIMKDTIEAIEKAEDNFKSENDVDVRPKIVRLIGHLSSGMRRSVGIATRCVEIKKEMYSEVAKAYERALKGFLRYKAAKESFEGEETNEDGGVFESAMDLV